MNIYFNTGKPSMNSMINKGKSSITPQKSIRFIAPGQLAKGRVFGNKTANTACGSKRISMVEDKTNDFCNYETTGVHKVQKLILHFGGDKLEEKTIEDEISFLDLLSMSKKFIDIYSVGFKLMDWDGKPLKNDKDVFNMLKEHFQNDVGENISVYLDVDESSPPLPFKLPEDYASSVPIASRLRDTSMEDGNGSATIHHNTEINVEGSTTASERNVRGRNMNKKVATLKKGEKLEIQFHNNRGVGPNHKSWSRHLGSIVRCKNVCPVQKLTWKKMTVNEKSHMWAVVKERFYNQDMEKYRAHTLEHMGGLWSSWRSNLKKKYVKNCKNKSLVLKKTPPEMGAKDWEWLVTNKFLTDKFQDISTRNSLNRAKQVMPHRSGSQPHRQIIYELEGETGTTPSIAEIFLATRQRNGKFVEPKEQEKYDEIAKTVQADTTLTPIDVVEACFGRQNHNHIFGFGGGMKKKDFQNSQSVEIEELKAKLHEKEEEANDLKRRFEEIESRLSRVENGNQPILAEP